MRNSLILDATINYLLITERYYAIFALQHQHHFSVLCKGLIALRLTRIMHTKKISCKHSNRLFAAITCLPESDTFKKKNGFHVWISKIISFFLRFSLIAYFLTSSMLNSLSRTSLSKSFFPLKFLALISRALATSFSRPTLPLNTIFTQIVVSSYVLVVSYIM